MPRIVDADKVAEAIDWLNEYDFVIWHDVMECIDKVPTVDVEPVKHAHWEWDGYIYDAPWQCSECGSFNEYDSNYCPDCGAKMGGKPIPNIDIITNKANTVTNNGNAMSTETKGENMPRLINANEILKSEHKHYDYMADEYYVLVCDIENAPTVDAEPVRHGHWVRNDNGTYSCSECYSWIPDEQHYYARYCLYCGARMDEVE